MFSKGPVVDKPIAILTDSEIDRIHSAVLDVLEKTGVVFQNREALGILRQGGCIVDSEKNLARFPKHLVEECLSLTPRSFTVQARDPENSVHFGDPNLYFSNWPGTQTFNPQTKRQRYPTSQDYIEAVRVLDALDGIHMTLVPYGYISDLAPPMWSPTTLVWETRYSSKIHFVVTGMEAEKWIYRIAEATGQQVLTAANVSAPLTWPDKTGARAIVESARTGNPIMLGSGLVSGGTAPATLAGSLVQSIAQILSGLVLAQLVRPGIGILAGNYWQPMDMRYGLGAQGAIERATFGAAFNQIFRRYGIPRGTPCSTDAKLPDYQCAYEKSMQLVMQALSGPNVIGFAGSVYDELIFSPIVATMDNDLCHMVARMLQGIEISSETLAVDLIHEVGPIPGHFLSKQHTRDWWRKEQYVPKLADRQSYPMWEKGGSKDLFAMAEERVKEILATHQPTPLPEDQDRELDNILREAEEYYKKKGWL